MNTTKPTERKNSKFLPRDLLPLSRNLLLIFGGIGAVVSLFGDFSEGGDLLNEVFFKRALYIVSVLHIILVFLVLFPGRLRVDEFFDFKKQFKKSIYSKEKTDEEVDKVQEKAKDFIKYWNYLWMTWGALYIIFFLDELWSQTKTVNYDPIVDFIMDFFMRFVNNAGSIFIILMVLTLYPFSKSEKKMDSRFWIGLLLLVAVTDIVVVYSSEYSLQFINKRGWFEFKCLYDECFNCRESTGEIISNIYGVVAATALAMLTGRLDSFYINAALYWTILIFIYAALQASFPFYTSGEFAPIKVTIAYTAFTLKGLFYIFVAKQFENWRI